MDVDEFVSWWERQDRASLDAVATALEATRETADGEVSWVRATREFRVGLRRAGQCRRAGVAAHRAIEAAMDACIATGLASDDADRASRVVRAAGDAAMCLVAGVATDRTATVLRPFFGSMVLTPA